LFITEKLSLLPPPLSSPLEDSKVSGADCEVLGRGYEGVIARPIA